MEIYQTLKDFAPTIVTAIGSGFLAWASVSVRQIHKTNQRVQQHDIGDLTEKEMKLLASQVGNSWLMENGLFVRGDAREFTEGAYDRGRKIGSNVRSSIHAVNGSEGLPIGEYGDAMRMLLVYGLMSMWVSKDGRPLSWVVRRTQYGEIEYLRQLDWDRRRSMPKRCVRALVGPMWRWTE